MEIYASSHQLLQPTSTNTTNLAEEDIHNDSNEFDHDRQRSTQADALQQRFANFEGEWIIRSTLLREISPEVRTFRSLGILITTQNTTAHRYCSSSHPGSLTSGRLA